MLHLFSAEERLEPTARLHAQAAPAPPLFLLDQYSPAGNCAANFSNPQVHPIALGLSAAVSKASLSWRTVMCVWVFVCLQVFRDEFARLEQARVASVQAERQERRRRRAQVTLRFAPLCVVVGMP